MLDGVDRFVGALLLLGLGGCASVTADITDTSRSGSEQLLLTGTSDRALTCLNFGTLRGLRTYLETSHVSAADSGWIIFGLRREMARQGLLLVDDKKDAQVIVEAAVAAYGTDSVDCRLSLPTVSSIGIVPLPIGSSDPHALSRKTRQDAVVKLALVALDAKTHHLVWESGTILHAESLDRRFIGAREVTRWSTMPEFDQYPRRLSWD